MFKIKKDKLNKDPNDRNIAAKNRFSMMLFEGYKLTRLDILHMTSV